MQRRREFRQWQKRLLAFCAVAFATAAVLVLTCLYRHHAPIKHGGIVSFELGGRTNAALLSRQYGTARLRSTIRWDFVLLAGYGSALLLGGGLAVWLTRQEIPNRLLKLGFCLGIGTVVADLLENRFLLLALAGHHPYYYDFAATFASLKFCAVVPAAVTALVGLGLAFVRAASLPHQHLVRGPNEICPPRPMEEKDVPSAVRSRRASAEPARWAHGYCLPDCPAEHRPDSPDGQMTGIGLSGGGIRAASLGLGALQSPGIRAILPRSQYLVSVSGGGYTAGALAMALAETRPPDLKPGWQVVRDPATVFDMGSPEEDYLRRHSSYLADNAGQLIVALAQLARHLMMTLMLLFGPAVPLGYLVGAFYQQVRLTLHPLPANRTTDQVTVHLAYRPSTWWALGLVAVLGAGSWLVGEFAVGRQRLAWRLVRRLFGWLERLFVGWTVAVLAVAVAVPGLIWLASWLLHEAPTPVHVASPIGAVLLTYVAGLASIAWRKRSLLLGKAKPKSGKPAPAAAAPRGFAQVLLVIAALSVLGAGWLLIFGGMATVGLEPDLARSTVWILLTITALVVFLGMFTDESTLSLHPFYRERLASAFAVRRVRTPDGLTVALPYQPSEPTTLSEYGRPAQPKQFPHIIFAASATVGQQRTAPGADRVSYTMCADWVGGPDVGYVATGKLEQIAPPRLKRDLTVQAAVAISGAAIAASVGGQGSKWYETLLAISGVRLGAWLPNPAFVAEHYARRRTVDRPGLPRIRRAHYLLRELFGGHPAGGALLQVTDGGFYDNLGLIELFRRGCTRIYLIDASGDTPPAAQTLSQTLIAAHQELGVRTCLDRTTWQTLTPGAAEPLSPKDPLAGLSARLSAKGVILGTFSYPDSGPYTESRRCRGRRGKRGRLVVAKASLWPELDYQLLAYAMAQPVFPHESTADQFFDESQYAGYTELGRALGQAAAELMQPPPSRWIRTRRCVARWRRRSAGP